MDYYVESSSERRIVDALKGQNPTVLVGSRGIGKSFLLRVAEREMLDNLERERVFPVYLTFSASSLIHTSEESRFQDWMLSRICSALIRALRKASFLSVSVANLSVISGGSSALTLDKTPIEKMADAFENSWRQPGTRIDTTGLPAVEAAKSAIEDLCDELGFKRISLLIDEAAHIFLPSQQRHFFTLFRDLRSAYISCNAAVYPGVTSFGETFQPAHDATLITFERDVLSADYVSTMKDIVEKQADSSLVADIARSGQNFALLSYAANGNPRVLLKTLLSAKRLSGSDVNAVIREYYRTDIWAEHSALAEKYPGHRGLVDWGRRFIEEEVLPDLQGKNAAYLEGDKKTSCFFWIHRDAPRSIKEALRLLAYTGIVTEHATGIKATRSEIGTRYSAHLGCLIALEATPTATGFAIARNLTPKRMIEFGSRHPFYSSLTKEVDNFTEIEDGSLLARQLQKPVSVLDLTSWKRDRLIDLGLNTVGDVLKADESTLQRAYYVGEIRARQMRNAALAAVYEYLSG